MAIDEDAVRQTAQDLKDMGIGDYTVSAPPAITSEPKKVFLTRAEEKVLVDIVWRCTSNNGRVSTVKNFIGDRCISPEAFGKISSYMTNDTGRQALSKALAGKVLSSPENLKITKVASVTEMVIATLSGFVIGGVIMFVLML